jgi:hypothetical protein
LLQIPYEVVLSSQTQTLLSFPDDINENLWLLPILLTALKAVVATSWPGRVWTLICQKYQFYLLGQMRMLHIALARTRLKEHIPAKKD